MGGASGAGGPGGGLMFGGLSRGGPMPIFNGASQASSQSQQAQQSIPIPSQMGGGGVPVDASGNPMMDYTPNNDSGGVMYNGPMTQMRADPQVMRQNVPRPNTSAYAGRPAMPMQQQPQAQQYMQPMQAPQSNSPMPIFNSPPQMPAISPQQQYMQRMGINRSGYNPQAMAAQSYAAPRGPQNFKPSIAPNTPSSAANDPAKPTDYQRMRDELDQLRDWQARYTGAQNDGGGGGR